MFGDISPKPLGVLNNTTNSIASLIITGNVDLFNAPTYSLNVNGSSLFTSSTNNVVTTVQTASGGNYGLNLTASSYGSSTRTALQWANGSSNNWEMGTDSPGNLTNDFYLFCRTNTTFSFKTDQSGNWSNVNSMTFNNHLSDSIVTLWTGFSLGIQSNTMLFNVPSGSVFKWFSGGSGTTPLMTINGSTGAVTTGNTRNTLDDGVGNMTLASTKTLNVDNITGASTDLVLNPHATGQTIWVGKGLASSAVNTNYNCTVSNINWYAGTTQVLYYLALDSSIHTQHNVLDDSSGNSTWNGNIDQNSGTMNSTNNTLDDGSGNITQVGTGDPIFHIRRSSYASSFISRIKLVDDNTSGKYWEIGTDVSGNKGGDLYFYGQGGSGLGLAMQLTAKGYLYLGYPGPWFQTTVTTPATGNQTITAAQLLGRIVAAPFTSSAFTWTTDTGTNIYSAMGSPSVGTTFECLISNTNNSAGAVMTIAFGTGVTGQLRGNTLNNNQSMIIHFRCTGTNTFSCYS